MKASVQVFKKDDATFENGMLNEETRWSYYISSFTNVEPTEGVTDSNVHIPFVKRTHPRPDENGDETSLELPNINSSENLVVRVCLENYRMLFSPKTDEWLVQAEKMRTGGKEGIVATEQTAEKRSNFAQEKVLVEDSGEDIGTAQVQTEKEDVNASAETASMQVDRVDQEMAEAN